MPWSETPTVRERMRFVLGAEEELFHDDGTVRALRDESDGGGTSGSGGFGRAWKTDNRAPLIALTGPIRKVEEGLPSPGIDALGTSVRT